MANGEQDSTRPRAVIMARGLSRRMGRPKGLLQLEEGGPAFVRIIADLYGDLGIPVDVVTLPENGEALRACLTGSGNVRVLEAGSGGETALTLLSAWREFGIEKDGCTHVWAHPVDLPLVTVETLEAVAEHSRRNASRVVRPTWRGTPGHPVVLPGLILSELESASQWHGEPLRGFLEHLQREEGYPVPLNVAVADEGVVRDFDRPGDLDPTHTEEGFAP